MAWTTFAEWNGDGLYYNNRPVELTYIPGYKYRINASFQNSVHYMNFRLRDGNDDWNTTVTTPKINHYGMIDITSLVETQANRTPGKKVFIYMGETNTASIEHDIPIYVQFQQLSPDTPPTTPSSISVNGDFSANKTVNVSWGASSDVEGDAITYIVEVSRNGGGYTTWINQAGRSNSYTIPSGTTSIAFRVRALANGAYSSYRTSSTYQVSSNSAPTLTLVTTDNRTLYENDQFNITGQVTDSDVGNVVTVKFTINGAAERAITADISQGTAITYNQVLTFKQGKLFIGSTAITDTLADGSQHVLRVWAEDDKGGKSAEQIRVFYVVANRSAILTIAPVASQSDLIDADSITFNGNVSDPDGNNVSVKYKIGNGSLSEVYNGTGGAFSFTVKLANLQTGVNTVTVQATDSYNLTTTKTLRVTKSDNAKPLLKSVATYKLTPPNGSADGIVLWIQRETGDLTVDAEISMGAIGAAEDFKPMIKASTAYVSDIIEEDEFTFDNATAVENIILRLTITRTSATSDKGIKLISGVLS